jgi:voltage-gated potassium channel
MTSTGSSPINNTMPSDANDQRSPWELLMLLLSLYVVFSVLVNLLFSLSPSTQGILWVIDTLICIVFFTSFVVQFAKAPRKWAYMKRWGWIDLLSSIPGIPGIPWTRALRFFRVVRAVRIIRNYRGVRPRELLKGWWQRRRAESVLAGALLVVLFLLIFSSLLILRFETAPESNIKTPADAIWWGIVTVSTVGYGDLYPVTDGGRFMASLLILAGVGLFTTLSGYLANTFFQPSGEDQATHIATLSAEVEELKQLLEENLRLQKGE